MIGFFIRVSDNIISFLDFLKIVNKLAQAKTYSKRSPLEDAGT